MTNPCKDCQDRFPGCHDHCERFHEWQENHRAEVDFTRTMNNPTIVYHYDYEDKHRHKGKKRYFGANGGEDR